MTTDELNFYQKKNAKSFLLFSYFGIANTDVGIEVIRAAINRAYRDASSRVLSFKEKIKRNEAK